MTPPFEGDFSHAVGDARKRLTASSGSAQGEWKADMTTDAGTRATVERVRLTHNERLSLSAVYEFGCLSNGSLYAAVEHIVAARVADALAAQPSVLAERLRGLREDWRIRADAHIAASDRARITELRRCMGAVDRLLAQEDR